MSAMKLITKETARSHARNTGKKVTLDDVWKTIDEIGKAQKETQMVLKETQKAHTETEAAIKETQKALKETQRLVGDLANKFGDEAEATLVPNLLEKFKQFNFEFDTFGRNRKINNKEYDIRAEIDALLENSAQVMAVEVKAKLQRDYVDSHVERMEKLRKYADLCGDKRDYFGAIAATVVDKKDRDYALENGFYVIEPSGEDVKVTPPDSSLHIW